MRILVIPGDGIGVEVMAEAKKLVRALGEKFSFTVDMHDVDWGAERYLRDGVGLPKGALDDIPKMYDAILFGALGDPRIPDMAHGREILLGLRFGLDLYVNLRPVKLMHQKLQRLKHDGPVDMIIFRENTEDLYLGLGHARDVGMDAEITIDESKHSFKGVERIVRAAFTYADNNGRGRVTLVDKSNAIKFGGSLWQRVFKAIAQEYPHINGNHLFVDVAAMVMVEDPTRFDVIVTSNLFGDILSDLGAGIAGGLGLAASANIHPGRIALFEPVHGSAPDIAGKNCANPFAMFMSVAMMMTYFGRTDCASLVEKCVIDAIHTGACTKDIGGSLTCSEAGDHVVKHVLIS